MIDLQTLLGIIFGVGGVGAITVLVTSYRRLKTGKLSDEESIIKRLHTELNRQEKRAKDAERDRDQKAKERQAYQEYATQLRVQLIENGIEPIEMKASSHD